MERMREPPRFSFLVVSSDRRPMKHRLGARLGLALAMMTLVSAQLLAQARVVIPDDDRNLYAPEELLAIYRHSPLGRLPPDSTNRVADDPQAAALGQFLFFDARFSPNGKISCASCHQAALAFTDGRALAEGMSVGTRNSP